MVSGTWESYEYGNLANGIKVVITNIIPVDDSTMVVDVAPLRQICHFIPSVKDPGDTPRTFIFTATAGVSNSIDVNPSGDAVGGLLSILSFGV
jgi:hypothetical protein